MTSLLQQLDPRQQEAVQAPDGPVLILAGAGSGKTRVITYRIAWLIEQGRAAPQEILAVTFTNKAAEEMRERVRTLLPTRLSTLPLTCTFHSLCARFLRREADALGLRRDFSIYDADDQQRLVKSILREFGEDDRPRAVRAVLEQISRSKTAGRTPEDWDTSAHPGERQHAEAFRRYVLGLKAAGALDFDDLLLETVRVLGKRADIREKWQRRYRYLLVDEYQDTNPPQYRLVRLLAPPSIGQGADRPNVFAVGDEDQSIYAWRGADYGNILRFEQDFPGTLEILLEQNYRSTQPILDAATAVIQNNTSRKGKVLWSKRTRGTRVQLFEAEDANAEARFVAETMWDLQRREPLARLACVYRTNAQSRLFEEALRKHNIGYRVVGGFSFYKRAEVRDLLAYVRLARNPLDQQSFLRIVNTPPRGIGAVTLERLTEEAASRAVPLWEILEESQSEKLKRFRELITNLQGELAGRPLDEALEYAVRESGYETWLTDQKTAEAAGRLENLHELIAAARESREAGESADEFLDRAALVSDADDLDSAAAVTLLTLHSAKGTEFDVVFLAGMEEGLFPHSRSTESEEELEEERRLCYVGMTRAKNVLYLVRALRRRGWASGDWTDTEPSRFLEEVPERLLERIGPPPEEEKSRSSGGDWSYEPVDEEEASVRRGFSPRRNTRRKSSAGEDAAALPRPPKPRSDPDYPPGTLVRHVKFGAGRVVGVDGDGSDRKIVVDFPGYGRKKLVERFAGLERV